MKLRSNNNNARILGSFALVAMLGLIATNCKKIEPERLVIVKTGSILKVTQTTCSANATLFDVGGASGVSEHGFCYSLTPDLSGIIDYTKLGPKKTKGDFEGEVDGLAPGTKYHLWSYATAGNETIYGNSLTFDTPPLEKPTLGTLDLTEVTSHSALSGGLILSNGGAEITVSGVCWNTSPNPTTANFKTSDGTGSGIYESLLTGLEPDVKYYIRAYATNGVGTGYGDELNFITPLEPEAPQVLTKPVEDITWNSAVGGGIITSEGSSEVTERGLCWSLQPNPTIADNRLPSGGGPGEFNIQMTGLTPETGYYIRAYAINSVDTAYASIVVFNTGPEPVEPYVVTADVDQIGTNSVHCGGSIDNDGGAPIISKGFCWSMNPNPTLADVSIEFGNGQDPFDMEIQGLVHNTEYHISAYATNSEGKTGYGNEQVFRTLFLCGSTLEDQRDLQEYATVPIGEQCWMAQNLNAGVMIDTSAGQGDNGTLERYCYDNNPANCDTYGGQYTWDEMMQYETLEMAQGVCPAGWHIPSDNEWKELETWLGMPQGSLDSTGFRGYNNEGGLLKSTQSPPWNAPNLGAIDPYGFSALPAGMIWVDKTSTNLGDFTVYWTSTFFDADYAIYRTLDTNETRIGRYDGGFRLNTTSVRCVKD